MKTKSVKIMIVSVMVAVAGMGVHSAQKAHTLSDITLANIEALAQGESSAEFEQRTGCIAVWENVTCRGYDGRLYSYARKK